ncbi:hypothetical protein [Streptomyces eurocidicus]|uniref:Uncharacterized protein n=1 Tax=Streptomyces eurocidicus TaxID=66423 RepID=A0A7W8BH94_STREU|nr:hypothetical protein [Streptomyces eurocidicus]MBB5122892.1 hypothetical protein [Streptomyces eurocidicus]
MIDEAGRADTPQAQDGDMLRVEVNGSGWVNGVEGVVAGTWEGRLRIRLTKNALPGVEAVLLEKDALWQRIGVVKPMPLCSSCGGSGKIEWTDEEGWDHEALCQTCNGEGEVNS